MDTEAWTIVEYPGGRATRCYITIGDVQMRRALTMLQERRATFVLPEAFFLLAAGAQAIVLRAFVLNHVLDWCPEELTDDAIVRQPNIF
jgi:hypothetical protein